MSHSDFDVVTGPPAAPRGAADPARNAPKGADKPEPKPPAPPPTRGK